MELVNGFSDGTNNGIVTTVETYAGFLKITTDVPRNGINNSGNNPDMLPWTSRNGIVLRKDADALKISWIKFSMTVSCESDSYAFEVERIHTKRKFTIPKHWVGKTVQVAYRVILQSPWGDFRSMQVPQFQFTSFNFLLEDEKMRLQSSKDDAEEAASFNIPTGATKMGLTTFKGAETLAFLLDTVELEIPARKFQAQLIDVCTQQGIIGLGNNNPLLKEECRWLNRTTRSSSRSNGWQCSLRGRSCRGFKTDCAQYVKASKCGVLRVREQLNQDDDLLQLRDVDYQWLFSQKTGMGYQPENRWRGDGAFTEMNFAVWTSFEYASTHFCHKFENQADHPHLLPCYASDAMEIPHVLTGGGNFWRYVDGAGNCDTTLDAGTHVEIVLKNRDVCLANPGDQTPMDGVPRAFFGAGNFQEPSASLAPVTHLPDDIPDGVYDLYLYCKNTSGQPITTKISNHVLLNGITNAVDSVYKVPESAVWAWVKLSPINASGDVIGPQFMGPRTRISVDIGGSGAGSLNPVLFHDAAREFAFKSLYIERVG